MGFLREPWMFWTAAVLLFLVGCFVLFQVIKYWHSVKWLRWPLVAVAFLAAGFFLRGHYDRNFGESCPPYVAPSAPIVPPLTEPSRPPEANTPETLEQLEPPAQ